MDGCGGHACKCLGSKQNRKSYNGLAWVSATIFISFFLLILCGDFISWLDMFTISGVSIFKTSSTKEDPASDLPLVKMEYPINCSTIGTTLPLKCPANYPVTFRASRKTSAQCPEYFRWIHEYLKPWKKSGITREVFEKTRNIAHFRLVIVKGKLYVEHFGRPYQTRDVYTIWGILQVLRLYPGKVPDLELMFFCNDRPIIKKRDYQAPNATVPPPLFRYCADDSAYDIPLPDWSFWGWPEINIKPWEKTFRAIQEGAEKTKWEDRVPYAYWKGNPTVARTRMNLMKCNATGQHEWNAELFVQNWAIETRRGFKNSNLEDQCNYRYKIYIEGEAWSVSEKYILSCNSMTLFVNPDYLDFFIRGMSPLEHYWPIRADNKCRDVKFAVEWGNTHTKEAQRIGEAASRFMHENVTMKFVHDYMFHLLSDYAKLLRFKPKIPPGAVEYCAETMACSYRGKHREAMEDSLIRSPSDELPCKLPPPYGAKELQGLLQRKEEIHKQVEMWEHEYWENLKKQQ